jgi:hypothetical protein
MPAQDNLPLQNDVGGGGILLGYHKDGSPCLYMLDESINGHVCVLGMSGAGKTHTISRLVARYREHGMTVFIPDIQGDLDNVPGAVDIPFRYRGQHGSVNPLRVDRDPESGGVYMAVRQVVQVIRMFATRLGSYQQADLMALANITYNEAGLFQDQPSTWGNEPPTLNDMQRHGSNIFAEIAGKEEDCYVRGHCWNPKRLGTVMHVLDNIVNTGLFSGDDLHIERNAINRFDLTKLHDADKKVMMHLLLERVFEYARNTCKTLNPRRPRLVLVLDEGKYASTWMDDLLSPLNRIATEGRKYGLALIMGVQSLRHLSEDAADNFGMTLILKLSDISAKRASQIFRVPDALLEQMKPRHDALCSFNGGRFKPISLAL